MHDWIFRTLISDYEDVKNPAVRDQYGKVAGVVGILSNTLLCVMKILVGLLSGSIAIVADAVNNLADASSSLITLIGFKLAGMPEDKEHPYGHARIEYLAGLLVSVIIIVVGLELGKSSIEKILAPTPTEFSLTVVIVLLLAIGIKIWQACFNVQAGKKINSMTLIATGADSRNDVICTGVVLLTSLGTWGLPQMVQKFYAIKDEKAMQTSVKDCGVLKVDTAVADSYKVTKNQITFTHGTSGQAVDKDALYESITEAVDSGDYETVISAPMKDSQPKALDIDKVYKKVYTKAKDATLDPKNNYAIVASTTGVSFDKKEAAAAIEGLEEGESKSISLKLTTADITTQNLEKNLFKDRLGGYSTNVAGTAARINNVRLASQHCNNTILLPGETFSYNEVVGQRTAARGFQEAGAYLNGKTVQELGGGICQVSSTLYCATVLSNLEIVHRENHMFESTYVPLGLDATVSWGGPDYVFKNNTKYPIKVVAGYANGVCTCEIWGTKTDNITVKFVNEVLSRNPYSTVTVKDDTKPVGYSAVTEEGENGSKVQTYRELYDGSGQRISRTKESFSVYTRRNQVVTVGTKKAEQKKKKTKKTDKKKNEQKQDTDQTAG